MYRYFEGDKTEVGLGIGWVHGPILIYKSISFRRNIAIITRVRFRFFGLKKGIPAKIIFKRTIINDFEKMFVRDYLNWHGMAAMSDNVLDDNDLNESKINLDVDTHREEKIDSMYFKKDVIEYGLPYIYRQIE